MNELKPCPFCGGKVRVTKGFCGVLFFKCTKCRAVVSFDNDTCNLHTEKAINHWNRRIEDDQ